jgi:putative flippase GtrA
MIQKIAHHVKRHAKQGWKFLICGATGALVDLGTLTLLVEHLHVEPHFAFAFSTVLASSVVFLLNKSFTFRERGGSASEQAKKFAMVYGTSIIMNYLLSLGFYQIGIQYIIARCLAIGVGLIWNYSMSHGFVFRKTEEDL